MSARIAVARNILMLMLLNVLATTQISTQA
jgi:hypothetical protein